jgi:2-oxoglutarate ferredoxin oxidoreductase subunit gamma
MYKEIKIAGFGGQGVVLAGIILGKAFALYEGLEAVMTQAYGPEARGGASNANIVVSDEPIDYPFVQHPDILVALSQEAYDKFRLQAGNGAYVLIDSDLVTPNPNDDPFCVPATRFAEDLGRRIVANVVMLGFLTGVTEIVTPASMNEAIATSVRPKTLELNKRAFAAGYDFAVTLPGINTERTISRNPDQEIPQEPSL